MCNACAERTYLRARGRRCRPCPSAWSFQWVSTKIYSHRPPSRSTAPRTLGPPKDPFGRNVPFWIFQPEFQTAGRAHPFASGRLSDTYQQAARRSGASAVVGSRLSWDSWLDKPSTLETRASNVREIWFNFLSSMPASTGATSTAKAPPLGSAGDCDTLAFFRFFARIRSMLRPIIYLVLPDKSKPS